MTLFTNQYFHGGVWGTLHNKSIKPELRLSDARLTQDKLSFSVFRVEGADVYGSFLIGISLIDANGNLMLHKDGSDLAKFPAEQIQNKYVTKVKPGAHSLVIPLGGKANLTIHDEILVKLSAGEYMLLLTDISGKTWQQTIRKSG